MTDLFTKPTSRRERGFTLTELLVVISIIVLVMALAVPLFNAFRGGRSVEGAENIVSAMLQRTRARAISLNERRGLFCYADAVNGNTSMVVVRVFDAIPPAGVTPTPPPNVRTYIEVDPGADAPQPLPVGVGAAFVVGYNTKASASTRTGYSKTGLIVFDAYGRIEPLEKYSIIPTYSPVLIDQYMKFTSGLLPNDSPAQYGIMLYDKGSFVDFFNSNAPGAGADDLNFGDEQVKWLDQNGLSLIVNRFNGTIFRGE